jgi:nicotinamidase-related amidase
MAVRRLGRLEASSTVFLCCDIQEAFRSAIHRFPAVVATAQRMLTTARTLAIPVAVTEQYPKGLKPTVAELDISSCLKVCLCTRALARECAQLCGAAWPVADDDTHLTYQDLHRYPVRQK